MKVKNYKGKSLDKLYQAVQRDLGSKAVIVSSRKLNEGGMLGILGASTYEVVAVADDHSSDRTLVNNTLSNELLQRLSDAQANQFKRMEDTVRELRGELRTLKRASLTAGQASPPAPAPRTPSLPEYAAGWDPRFIKNVRGQMPGFFGTNQISKQYLALAACMNIEENFPVAPKPRRPQTIALVGPTGSGKTTTVAKLAARWSIEQGLKVGLITTDTYRVAAIDQISEYATLLGIDLKVVFNPAEAERAAHALADRDLILVDTAGRNHYDQKSLADLRALLDVTGPFSVMLTLPATWNKELVPEMIRNYGVLKPNYLIVTKIDETKNYDIMTVARCETTCPVAFYTNGQRVPQDIEPARMEKTVKMLLQK